ncbi:MAG: type VI secretion protein IcmF/TssM N-terminal domain-containing protein [Gammaproteobacteria bacterium]|nr:type VI secretion protein IcmF/TssM N-terminal domain-containing protein [Gammaproteobacteria bacterium]
MSAEIIHKLKKSGLSLYDLPWFMVLGPKRSGKSTLLQHSGLVFSWEYQDTHHWLFSDKAVFIEVDIYSDAQAILNVLQFLKQHRVKLPLNGMLLALALPLTVSPHFIREKLAEIIDGLGYVLPVITVFTHLDSIKGFSAFFQNNTEAAFQYEDKSYDKLMDHVLPLLSSQASIKAKFDVLDFPEHFRECHSAIKNFIESLMKDNPYYEAPDFREIYFTASSYFVPGIFQRLLEMGARATLKSRRHIGLGRWVMSISLLMASVIIIGAFLIISASFARNTIRIQQGVHLGKVAENSSQRSDFLRLTQYLISAPPQKLISPLQNILMHGLEQYVMPNAFNVLENQLALMQEQWALATSQEAEAIRGNYYNQLKLYLMFGEPRYRYAAFYQDDPMMAFYLNHSHKRWPVRPDYIQLSRQQLMLPSNLANVYAGLKSWGQKQLGDISAQDLFGSSLDKTVKLSRFFTATGFSHYALPEIARLTKESWVMQSASDALNDKLLRLYKSDYRQEWLVFLQNLRPVSGETISEKTVHKIMVMAHENVLFKETDDDPMVKAAVQNILRLPQVTKIMAGIEAEWQSQVFEFYREHIALKYPFYDSPDEILPQDFNKFQEILSKFIQDQSHTKLNFSEEYLKSVDQAKFISSSFEFELYPEPTLGLKEIRLVTNKQTYRYRNDPQEWQSMQWKLVDRSDETSLEVVTANGSVGNIEFDSPWGLFRLFQKAIITPVSHNEFRAQWSIRADNGRNYRVDFLVKTGETNNLLKLVLFQRFELPERVF